MELLVNYLNKLWSKEEQLAILRLEKGQKIRSLWNVMEIEKKTAEYFFLSATSIDCTEN